MEGAGIDTDEKRCTRCLAREAGCATMEKTTNVSSVGIGNDGEGNPLERDARAGRALPNETRAVATQPKEVPMRDEEHLSMEQANDAKPKQSESKGILNNESRDKATEDPFANGKLIQSGLQNIGQGEVDMVSGQNPAESNCSPPIHVGGNLQVPHLAASPSESLPVALQQNIDSGKGVDLTVPQKAPSTVARRDSKPETTGIGTIPDDKYIPAPGENLSPDRGEDQRPPAERDAQGLLNTAALERENNCTPGPLQEERAGEQVLLSSSEAKGDGFLQDQDATLDSRRQDEGPLQGKNVDATPQEENNNKQDAQDNGKSKRKLGEAVSLKSKKSAKRGTKGKQAYENKKKEQTVQVSQLSCTEKSL